MGDGETHARTHTYIASSYSYCRARSATANTSSRSRAIGQAVGDAALKTIATYLRVLTKPGVQRLPARVSNRPLLPDASRRPGLVRWKALEQSQQMSRRSASSMHAAGSSWSLGNSAHVYPQSAPDRRFGKFRCAPRRIGLAGGDGRSTLK
eukprot:SAG25_NODE_162_length_13200_cov_4.969163_6_plen_151_part_00